MEEAPRLDYGLGGAPVAAAARVGGYTAAKGRPFPRLNLRKMRHLLTIPNQLTSRQALFLCVRHWVTELG